MDCVVVCSLQEGKALALVLMLAPASLALLPGARPVAEGLKNPLIVFWPFVVVPEFLMFFLPTTPGLVLTLLLSNTLFLFGDGGQARSTDPATRFLNDGAFSPDPVGDFDSAERLVSLIPGL